MHRRRLLALLPAAIATAASPSQFRAFWVDTFNTPLNTHADVLTLVQNARAANANMLFVQVRRRGDAWYLNSLEPLPDSLPIPPGFDPLYDLIQSAHSAGLQVHAFVIVGAIWNRSPAIGPPTSPFHVFNRHSGYDPATNSITPGPDNWLTRTLLPDGAASVTYQGHRIGAEFWLDFGHPDAAAYSVEVVLHLIRNYPIDGLHLDRIRYPELAAPGANIGYNAVSVHRFQRRHGIPHDTPPPAPADPLWSQWRRDQVTNLVRRIYLNAIAIRPSLVVSAALIAFGSGPANDAAWPAADAYWRVFQDWRAWLEEGILDLAIPMNYKRESVAQQTVWFDQWNQWTRAHQYNRAAFPGLGVYLNSIPDSLAQIRRALEPDTSGVALYSFAAPDNAQSSIAQFAAALTNAGGPFSEPASIPTLPWKATPAHGHLMGSALRPDGSALDSADVYIFNEQGQRERQTVTDAQGFFGAVDLPPGTYVAVAALQDERLQSVETRVNIGDVATVRFL
ncbi:MAG: family 10 glycosylhydrolase [Bryobacterales bacterium]|nr:family 10 glycosylhydrolase [Bryobacterales bacterium]